MEKVLREILADFKKDMLVEVRQIVKEEVAEIKEDVARLKEDVAVLKEDVAGLHKKMDILTVQVAHNTEQEVKIDDVIFRVAELETDMKVIKKAIAKQ